MPGAAALSKPPAKKMMLSRSTGDLAERKFFGSIQFGDEDENTLIDEGCPRLLRAGASGMGFSYGIGNLGKIIGPLGLALIVGSSNYVSPKVTLDALLPALLFLAFWYGQAELMFGLLGFETKGRSIEEIDSSLKASAATPVTAGAAEA